jgi:predicted transcriptional regulator
MVAKPPPRVHELEGEVMEYLWETGESPVRTVMEALNDQPGPDRAYTTYMTIMARLHRKGLLARRREGKTDYYVPKYTRERYMTLRARAEVDELVAQYGDVALSQFADRVAGLDPARREQLERLARDR